MHKIEQECVHVVARVSFRSGAVKLSVRQERCFPLRCKSVECALLQGLSRQKKQMLDSVRWYFHVFSTGFHQRFRRVSLIQLRSIQADLDFHDS